MGVALGEGKAADGRACGRGTHGFTPMALLLGCPLIECQGYQLAEQEKELRRLSLALLVRPQWFHLNRAEGES